MDHAIEVAGVVKRYGDKVALAGIDFDVARGSVCGVLGPNGAGKTTAVRVLTTLTVADEGRASVGGIDVAADPAGVRGIIGLAAQDATVDGLLTGRENLVMVGRLNHLGRARANTRADELLEQFSLTDAAGRMVKTYSGGMRRRLDLAATLVSRPEVLFLDEPTTGLDPRARNELWDVLDTLVAEGATILLTTQYLDEADRLADDIVVIDHGRVIARGDATSLKRQVGGAQLHVTVEDPARREDAARAVAAVTGTEVTYDDDGRTVNAPTADGARAVAALAERLRADGIAVDELALQQPTLDDVFLTLTGTHIEDEEKDA